MKAPLCLTTLCITTVLISFAGANGGEAPVKNVIYLIGDGMGVAQVSAAIALSEKPLNFERATAVGLAKTASASHYVTDSAAGGTALSTGFKTTNGAIGILPDGSPAKTVLEYARDSGRSTGVLATCSITHATPGAFLAHQKTRKMQEEIAEDIVVSDVDVAIGGGRKFFEERGDGRNLSDTLRSKNYSVVYTLDDVLKAKPGKVIGLLAPDALPSVIEGRGDLAVQSTTKTLDLLSKNPKGFFLMIEGSQIDWGGHKNDADYTIAEMRDFDAVIGKAMDFADANPDTLVVITADHETGGLTLPKGEDAKTPSLTFSTKSHTGIMVPVYAYGAGAEKFSGIYENTEVFHKIMRLLQLSPASGERNKQ